MKIILIFIFSIVSFQLSAQDPEFSQSYSSSLSLNPAFAGALEHPSFSAGLRIQSPLFSSDYIAYIISYNQNIEKLYGGIGVYYVKDFDTNGALSTSSINLC